MPCGDNASCDLGVSTNPAPGELVGLRGSAPTGTPAAEARHTPEWTTSASPETASAMVSADPFHATVLVASLVHPDVLVTTV
jgi:hypothetical protein